MLWEHSDRAVVSGNNGLWLRLVYLLSLYHADLKYRRADQACEFLLRNPNFTNWYHTSDSQQLVILGDMVCGKSLTTSFLIDKLGRRNKYQLPEPKICYYYCRDDNTGNAISILSALILSLLWQLPGQKKPFSHSMLYSMLFNPITYSISIPKWPAT